MSIEIHINGEFFPKEEAEKYPSLITACYTATGSLRGPGPITGGFLNLTNILTGCMIPPRP